MANILPFVNRPWNKRIQATARSQKSDGLLPVAMANPIACIFYQYTFGGTNLHFIVGWYATSSVKFK